MSSQQRTKISNMKCSQCYAIDEGDAHKQRQICLGPVTVHIVLIILTMGYVLAFTSLDVSPSSRHTEVCEKSNNARLRQATEASSPEANETQHKNDDFCEKHKNTVADTSSDRVLPPMNPWCRIIPPTAKATTKKNTVQDDDLHTIVFLHHPKAGGKSFEKTLQSACRSYNWTSDGCWYNFGKIPPQPEKGDLRVYTSHFSQRVLKFEYGQGVLLIEIRRPLERRVISMLEYGQDTWPNKTIAEGCGWMAGYAKEYSRNKPWIDRHLAEGGQIVVLDYDHLLKEKGQAFHELLQIYHLHADVSSRKHVVEAKLNRTLTVPAMKACMNQVQNAY